MFGVFNGFLFTLPCTNLGDKIFLGHVQCFKWFFFASGHSLTFVSVWRLWHIFKYVPFTHVSAMYLNSFTYCFLFMLYTTFSFSHYLFHIVLHFLPKFSFVNFAQIPRERAPCIIILCLWTCIYIKHAYDA